FYASTTLLYLPSFPTRRSSDLLNGSKVFPGIDVRIPLCPVLLLVELAVPPGARDQLAMRAALHDLAVLEDEDLVGALDRRETVRDRKSTRLNSSHVSISYAVFC